MKHSHLAWAVALIGVITLYGMPILAQEAARSQAEKLDDYPIIDFTLISLGPQSFSGNIEETLDPSWRLSGFEFYYALPFLRMLRIGINALDGSDHEYLLTPSEKEAISSRYEIVTVTELPGGIKTETRKPLTKVYAGISSQSLIARLYPLRKGISLSSSMKALEPFIGAGVIHHSLTDDLPAAAEGITTVGEGSGFSTFLNTGIDLIMGPFFMRIEYLKGRLPDWNVKLLPELRAIKGGEYSILKIGIGVAVRKWMFVVY